MKVKRSASRTPKEVPAWRQQAFDQFSNAVELPLLLLAILMVPVLIVPLIAHLDSGTSGVFDAIDYFIWAIFAIELIVKVVLAPRRGHYLAHNPFDVVVVGVPLLRPLRIVRSARALRLLRLGRLGAFAGGGSTAARKSLHIRGLGYVAAVTGFLIVITSLVVYDLERTAPHSSIHTWPDSLWWAIVTVTTVGYGDKFPVTPGGRAIATVLMFSGIALVSVLTAALATFFVSRLRSDRSSASTANPVASDADAPWSVILDRLAAMEATLAQIAGQRTLPDESTI